MTSFPEIGRKIGEAEEIRHASDYDDFYVASVEETERQISAANEFIGLVEAHCKNVLKSDEVFSFMLLCSNSNSINRTNVCKACENMLYYISILLHACIL